MESILSISRTWLRQDTVSVPSDDMTIHSVFPMVLNSRPSVPGPYFRDDVLLIVTKHGGYATLSGDKRNYAFEQLIGQDVRQARPPDPEIEMTCLDAGLLNVPVDATFSYELVGTVKSKADQRSSFIADEVDALTNSEPSSVLLVGAVTSIVKELKRRSHSVTLRDLDSSLFGQCIAGSEVPVNDIAGTIEAISHAQVCVLTGMTLVNGTFDALLVAAKMHRVPIILYAQSCAGIAARLARAGVVDASLCEPWPNYFFPGTTRLHIHRRPQ